MHNNLYVGEYTLQISINKTINQHNNGKALHMHLELLQNFENSTEKKKGHKQEFKKISDEIKRM